MKKLIVSFIVISVLILSSCNPCKRLALKCPAHDSTTIIETITLDTIWINTPVDSLDLIVPMPVLVDLADLGIIVEDEEQKITVRIIHDTLLVEAQCKEDSLMAVIEHQKIEINKKKIVYRDVEVEVPVVKNGKFAKFTMIVFFCFVVLLVGYIYLKVRSGTVKTVLNQLQKKITGIH